MEKNKDLHKTNKHMAEDKNTISLRKILNVAKIEFTKWIFNPRIIIFVVLYMFLYDYIVEEMLAAAKKMDSMIMIYEPFVAMANSELLIMIIPAVFIVLISDFPKTDGNTMFYISRVGKINWLLGQIIFAISSAVTYLLGILGISIIMVANQGYSKNVWSPLVTDYVKTFPNDVKSRIPMLINGRLYNNMTPTQALILTLSLLLLMLVVIEFLLLVGFSIGKRILGMLFAYMVIGLGSSFCALENGIMWAFPSANSIAWLHFDPVLKKQDMKITTSFLYFIIIMVVMFVVSIITMKHYDFSKVTDMED